MIKNKEHLRNALQMEWDSIEPPLTEKLVNEMKKKTNVRSIKGKRWINY